MLKIKLHSVKLFHFVLFLLISTFLLSSCEIIGDIFEAGVWTGVILIVLVVALLIYVFSRFRGRR